MVEGAGLENRSRASDRGFESHPLRQLPIVNQLMKHYNNQMPNQSLVGLERIIRDRLTAAPGVGITSTKRDG